MSVYKRNDCEHYSYDFRLDGERYSGSTGTADLEDARRFEAVMKADLSSVSAFCRVVIRRARRRIPIKARNSRGYVYMIRSGYFIKIGHSINPAERIQTISTSTPDECELLFCIPGSLHLERQLHREFSASHYKKEWFFLCGKLKHFVAEIERQATSADDGAVTADAAETPPMSVEGLLTA